MLRCNLPQFLGQDTSTGVVVTSTGLPGSLESVACTIPFARCGCRFCRIGRTGSIAILTGELSLTAELCRWGPEHSWFSVTKVGQQTDLINNLVLQVLKAPTLSPLRRHMYKSVLPAALAMSSLLMTASALAQITPPTGGTPGLPLPSSTQEQPSAPVAGPAGATGAIGAVGGGITQQQLLGVVVIGAGVAVISGSKGSGGTTGTTGTTP